MPQKAGFSDFVQINGKPYKVLDYSSNSSELLPDGTRSGPITYADRKGEETVAQATWHKGFGRGEIRAAQTFVRSADVADIGRYHYSQNVDARTRGQLILGPQTTTDTFASNAEAKVQYIQFNGTMFAIGARYVHTLSGTTWTVDKDMGASAAAVKGCATIFGGKLYVADGNSIVLSRTSGGSWASAITGMTTPVQLATVGTTMWVMSNSNQLQSTTDGSTLATAISVGSGVDISTALFDYNGFPHIAKPDGLFFYDGQNLWNVYPELARRIATTNGKGTTVGRGTAYLPFAAQVVGYSADLIVPDVLNLTPDRVSGLEARGFFLDFWPDADYLWGLLLSQGGNYYITSYDYNPTPGQGWHQVISLGSAACTAIGIQAGAAPIGFVSQGTNILRYLLAQRGVNPYADTNYRFAGSGDIYLSQESDDFDDVQKSYISVVLDTANCAAGRTVAIKYTLDAGTEQSLVTITTNGSQEFFFPSGTTGKRLSIHLALATNDATKSPQVLPIARRYKRRFTRVAQWKMTLDCARMNQNVTIDPLSSFTNLITAANTVDSVAFVDIDGTQYNAYVDKVNDLTNPEKQNNRNEKVVEVLLTQRRNSASVSQAAVSTYSTTAKYS